MRLDENARPRLPRHVKFRFDPHRQCWVLLGPERVLMPDETAVAVLQRCTGDATLASIIDALASEYDADRSEVAADVTELLDGLAAQGLIAR